MLQDNRYACLFEPVAIGPVTAKNRFYQVPHCCGMGHLRPRAHAAMRAMKAEGGWAVVSTEEAEIHPSSDLSPYPEQRIWDERDIPALRLMTDAVHERGALAAIELVHNGHHASNLYSRIPAMAPTDMPLANGYPKQARAMDKSDIRHLRQWHRQAALRARQAGFDIVYVYAGHEMTLAQHFLLPQFNTRTDEYGGSLENRARLLRELLQDTREAIGDTCAVAFRFAVDELKGDDGMQAHEEGRAVVEYLADLPDLWDVNVSDWANDSLTTRFEPEDGYQVRHMEFVKSVTDKPVVGVGRLTSPDLMVSLVKRRVVDFIGAARPSIADPFLPLKIEQNRTDEIRECIGCNICVSSDSLGVPIRCTQNPTMGEEWRRGWHPEQTRPKISDAACLVVGAGPAGLECALQLSRRGYDVTLAEKSDRLGGRVRGESGLNGLSAWLRVHDNRAYELRQKANVEIFTNSDLSAEHIIELGVENVFLATGSRWKTDGTGRSRSQPIAGLDQVPNQNGTSVVTADNVMAGAILPDGPVVVYDDDHGYMGGVIAGHLRDAGHDTTIVTSASLVSPWTSTTLEQERIQKTLIREGVEIVANRTIVELFDGAVATECVFSGRRAELDCRTLVLVTGRVPEIGLYRQLAKMKARGDDRACDLAVTLIGDALAPGLIADAVFSGHLAARNFQVDPLEIERDLFRREIPSLENPW